MDKLPRDIMLDILFRLPHESIINCKLVSKPLSDITNNISEGFIFQLGTNPALKICYGSQKHDDVTTVPGNYSYKTIIDDNHPSMELESSLSKDDNHPSMELESSLSYMVGSCNGLVCCSVLGHDAIYICNPITEEYVYLPTLYYNNAGKAFFHCGFGYHHSTNEYKVVRIYYGHVRVYTLGSSHGWRYKGRIEHHLDYISGVCANGCLHWIDDRKKKIVAFDLGNEKFRLIPFPQLSLKRTYSASYLQLMFGGYLCVIHIDVGREDAFIHVWALEKKKKFSGSYDMRGDDFDDFWRWNKKFSIPCARDARYHPFAVTKSNQVLMRSDGTIFCYDLGTKVVRKLCDDCPMRNNLAIPHVNSLVSLAALGEKSKTRK